MHIDSIGTAAILLNVSAKINVFNFKNAIEIAFLLHVSAKIKVFDFKDTMESAFLLNVSTKIKVLRRCCCVVLAK